MESMLCPGSALIVHPWVFMVTEAAAPRALLVANNTTADTAIDNRRFTPPPDSQMNPGTYPVDVDGKPDDPMRCHTLQIGFDEISSNRCGLLNGGPEPGKNLYTNRIEWF
jgi:hypothetical protein